MKRGKARIFEFSTRQIETQWREVKMIHIIGNNEWENTDQESDQVGSWSWVDRVDLLRVDIECSFQGKVLARLVSCWWVATATFGRPGALFAALWRGSVLW